MQRNALTVLLSVSLLGLGTATFANEAQPELQPKRLEFDGFKFPVGSTSFVSPAAATEKKQQDYRYLTDYSAM